MNAEIVYAHGLKHSCALKLRRLVNAMNGQIVAGTVAECTCGQAWMVVPEKPWWRRGWPLLGNAGWWIREPRKLRLRRLDDEFEEDFEALVEQEAERR